MAELKDVLTALGIAEDADPVAAIATMKAHIVSMGETIAGSKPAAEAQQLADVTGQLASVKQQLIIEQSENARQIAQIKAEGRRNKVEATVDKAIAMKGKPPVMRDQLIEVGMMMAADKFDEFLATVPSIDLTERGVATGSELAELEPSSAEITIAKQMGQWNDTDPAKSRMAIMREKAKAKGMTLPAEVK